MSEAAASGSTPDSQQFGRIVLGGRTAHLESSVGTLKLHPGGVGWKSRETGNVIASGVTVLDLSRGSRQGGKKTQAA